VAGDYQIPERSRNGVRAEGSLFWRWAKLIDALKARQDGSLVVIRGRGLTLAQFAERWLAASEARIRPRTRQRYWEVLDGHILPNLGKLQLTKVEPRHVKGVMSEMRTTGLSARSANYARQTLRALLNDAMREGLIGRNVAQLVRSLPQERKEPAVLTPDQARLVLEVAQHDPGGPLWVLGLTTGARASELLGLRWGDVDLEDAQIRIRQTVQETPKPMREQLGRWLVQLTKTEKSRRTVPLVDFAVEALRRQRHQQNQWRLAAGSRWEDAGLVFTSTEGGPLAVTTVSHRWSRLCAQRELPATTRGHILEMRGAGATLAEIAERLIADGVSPGRGAGPWSPTAVARVIGLPRVKFHAATRHSVASFLLAAGVPLKTVSDLLGHSQIATTGDIYTHVAEVLKRDAADAIGRLLG
jgi:integrase